MSAATDFPVRGPGRPPKGYYVDNVRVPSATTITGYLKSQQLMVWANREGLEGRDINERRDAAATAGTIAHAWIECFFHGEALTAFPDAPLDVIRQAEQGFAAFQDWASQVRPRILESEVPLTSRE